MKQNSIPGFLVVLVLTLGMVAGGGYMWYFQTFRTGGNAGTPLGAGSTPRSNSSKPARPPSVWGSLHA